MGKLLHSGPESLTDGELPMMEETWIKASLGI